MATDPNTVTTPAVQQQNGAPPAASQQSAPAESEQPNGKGWEAAKQFKAELDTTKAKLAALEADKSKREQDEAASKGQYEKLWKDEVAKRESVEQQNLLLTKRGALATELNKLGLDGSAANLIDLGTIENDGKNAGEVAKRFADAFGKTKGGAPFPTPTPTPGGASGVKVPSGLKAGDVANLDREQKQAVADSYFGNGGSGGFFRK